MDDDEVWTQVLESALGDRRIRAEVLNFGVGGYGMGQAYLRWQHAGQRFFAPTIVIFGFQPENLLYRNGERVPPYIRSLYRDSIVETSGTILQDNELELVNFPALPPARLMEVYEDFDRHPLSTYEYSIILALVLVPDWWPFPRLADLVSTSQFPRLLSRARAFGPDSERLASLAKPLRWTLLPKTSAKSGASFIVMHLPVQFEISLPITMARRPSVRLLTRTL